MSALGGLDVTVALALLFEVVGSLGPESVTLAVT